MKTINESMTQEERDLYYLGPQTWGGPAVRVARGAAFLDREMPGWEQKVQINTLQMASGCDCVLGQLFGAQALQYRGKKLLVNGYDYATDLYGLDENWPLTDDYDIGSAPAVFFGFDVYPDWVPDEDGKAKRFDPVSFPELASEWRALLQERVYTRLGV